MVVDKCELSLELLQKASSSFLRLSLVMINLLICAHMHTCCAMSAPSLLQHYHSIHSDEEWFSMWLPSCVWVQLGSTNMYV